MPSSSSSSREPSSSARWQSTGWGVVDGERVKETIVSTFKYSYNALVYHGEDIARSVDRVARFGYDAIEVVGEPEQFDPRRIKKLTEDAGIRVSSICPLYTASRDLVHPEANQRARAVQYVRDVAEFAAEMECPTIIVHPTANGKTQRLASEAEERKWAVNGIREGGEYAARLGVNLSLECWNRYETYFLNRLEQAASLWQEAGLRNGGIQGDTFHMNLEEESIEGAFRLYGTLLQHVHLADSNRAAPGSGHLDFRPILQSLVEVGYDKYLSFELLPAFADPFAALAGGGGEEFFDAYTEQAIRVTKNAEPQPSRV
jgi:sugar phosphate isomerase/epimerase